MTIKNYSIATVFKSVLRNFRRNKIFSVINVLGLSIGISASLVIFLIVQYEFSYDKFEKDNNRIYRVVMDMKINGMEGHSAAIPAPLSTAIENEVTGVEKTIPVIQCQGDATAKVTIGNDKTGKPLIFKHQPKIIFTNNQYLQLLNYTWIAGSAQSALNDPFSVVLTKSRSQQYFGNIPLQDIVGKKIIYNDNITATVFGIVKDLDENTDFTGAEFISFRTIAKTGLQNDFMMNTWNDWMAYSQLYVKLNKPNNPANTETQLKALLKKYNKNANKDAANAMNFRLQPLNDVHFNTFYQGLNQRIVSRTTMYGLLAIAAFLLLLGCINFINLTTANAVQRAKEIGIRKTMGSSKANLVFQFLSETFFINIIATLLSVALTPLLLKMFSDYIPLDLHFDLLHHPSLIIFLVLLTVIVSILSGLYPAFILSRYNPALVLKNQAFTNSSQSRNAWVRKTLTVSQFVVAQFFVIETVMVSKQIDYAIHSDKGFNTAAIINFETPRDTVAAHTRQLLTEVKTIPGIDLASTGFFAPADEGGAFTDIAYNNGKEELKPSTQIRFGDPNFIKVYGIKLLAGRNILPSDTIKEFLVNESYTHAIGFNHAESAIDKYLDWNGKKVPIVGVMKDFHEQSFHAMITPVVFGGCIGSTFHIKLQPNNAGGTSWKNTVASIQKIYSQIYPGEDFNYTFFDETIAKLYQNEQHTALLLKWATALAILISCLGLLGLVIYTTNSRTKEIGIRKVLGASVAMIITLLSRDFVRLVLIAFIIATPLAWWAAYSWLQDFAYRTNLSWWIFLVCGVAMIAIALITLSVQTIRTAMANPVKSLRTE